MEKIGRTFCGNAKCSDEKSFCALFSQVKYIDGRRILGKISSVYPDEFERIQNNIYVGPSYSNDEIKSFLDTNKIQYKFLATDLLLKTTAKLISEGNIVGWFQGKMEWGPRTLGNRSILADPRDPKMKDILNEKIKHRELFRPFAPSILEEYVSEYFELDIPSPYMLLVAKIKKPEKIPA